MNRIKENKFVLLTFVVAAAIMTIVLGEVGMYPFGDRQIMIIDSWHQYYPIFQELNYRLTSSESLLWSWNSGMGTNFITMLGYYAMSPLNLLSVFWPKDYLREFFWMATVVKIALGGTFFSIYIRKIFKRNDLSITVFGLMYAFSGFFMGFYWNTMWLDSVAMLPLIIMGLHKLMDENKYRFYVVTLMLAVVSNFYIGYFICEFIALYYVALYIIKFGSSKNFWHFCQKTIQAVVASVVGIALGAIMLLPIFYGMSRAYGQSSGDPTTWSTYHALFDMFNNLLINITPTIVDGLPNVSSTMVGLLFMILFFSVKKIPMRTKMVNGGFVLFLFMSMNINMLNFVWHGLHFPNQVPYRFSFLVSFLILTMAYEVFCHLDEIDLKVLGWVVGVGCIYFLANEKMENELFDFTVFYLALLAFLIYGAVIYAYRKEWIALDTMTYMFFVCVMAEAFLIAGNAVEEGGSSGRKDYFINGDDMQNSIETVYERDPDFYRMEMTNKYGTNDALTFRYRGISQFSSTANSKVSAFTKDIGMPSDAGSNTISFRPSTPALHGMFALKYILSREDSLPTPNDAYDVFYETEKVTVYENRFALPLGYMVNADIKRLDLNKTSPFDKQEDFYQLATGFEDSFFITLEASEVNHENMKSTRDDGPRHYYKNIDSGATGVGHVNYVSDRAGQAYLYMLNQNDTMDLTVNGVTTSHETRRGIIVDLGHLEAGDTIEATFDVYAQDSGYYDMEVVYFDEEAFLAYYDALSVEPLMIDEFTDRSITGTVTSVSDGLLYTSIPYEEGWTVKVDGQKVEPQVFKEAMLLIPVSVGTHEIELNYTPRGLMAGSVISLVTLFLLVGLFIMEKRGVYVLDFADDEEEDLLEEVPVVAEADVLTEPEAADEEDMEEMEDHEPIEVEIEPLFMEPTVHEED